MQLLHDETERLCKNCAWRPFTEAEMRITMARWKNHKATGPDGVAPRGTSPHVLITPVGSPKLLRCSTTAYIGDACPLQPCKEHSVLLPKCVQPANWSDTRPITLSSAVLKWISQLLLHRGVPSLQACCMHQWGASKGKQGVELVLSLRKLARVAHEWKSPFYIVKIDIAKAFDSIAQEQLGSLVVRRIAKAGCMPWEARLWLSLLESTRTAFPCAEAPG